MSGLQHLRVLIANERQDRLKRLAMVLEGLGHEVVARETSVVDVGIATARERPDVAIVGLGESSEHALEMISVIVREAFCPVIALTHSREPGWVDEAAKRGIYAYIIDEEPEELQATIDVTLRRFAQYQSLHGAFERRNADAERAAEFALTRARVALELHDGVVQGLAIAHLALEVGDRDQTREALLATLTQAKQIVGRAVDELKAQGVTQEQLIRDAAVRQGNSQP